jgi:hypothetical protein
MNTHFIRITAMPLPAAGGTISASVYLNTLPLPVAVRPSILPMEPGRTDDTQATPPAYLPDMTYAAYALTYCQGVSVWWSK